MNYTIESYKTTESEKTENIKGHYVFDDRDLMEVILESEERLWINISELTHIKFSKEWYETWKEDLMLDDTKDSSSKKKILRNYTHDYLYTVKLPYETIDNVVSHEMISNKGYFLITQKDGTRYLVNLNLNPLIHIGANWFERQKAFVKEDSQGQANI